MSQKKEILVYKHMFFKNLFSIVLKYSTKEFYNTQYLEFQVTFKI